MKYAIPQANGVDITKGKKYSIRNYDNFLMTSFEITDDVGSSIGCLEKKCSHLEGANWTITDMKTYQEELDELRLEQIEQDKKIARLEKKLKEDNGPLFIPKCGDDYIYLETDLRKGVYADNMRDSGGTVKAPQFRKESTAKAFAEAINIWFEWNMCEGRVEPKDDTYQYYAGHDIDTVGHQALRFKPLHMSVFFDTRANCQASIDKIGKDRIEACRRGLHLMG